MSPLESLASFWLRSVYGVSCKTSRFRRCQRVKTEGSLARNARFEAPMCLLLSLWLLSSFAVSMGEAAKRGKIEGSLARNARYEAPTCLLLSLWLLSGFAVSMGESE